MVLTTRQFTSQQYDASSIKGQGPIVLARAAACQVVGLLVQLGELSQFALDIYQALGYETYGASARIDAVAARTAKIEHQLSIYSEEIESTPPSFYFHNSGDVKWNRSDGMTNNLFSPESRSVPLSKLVNAAFSPPNLQQMSEFSGKNCTILYSDPGFFFKHWAAEEVRKLDAQKEERKKNRDRKPRAVKRDQQEKVEVQAINVKVYSAHGHEFGTTTNTTAGGSSSSRMSAHTVAAPRPLNTTANTASPQIQRVPSYVQSVPSPAPLTNAGLTNHHSHQEYQHDDYGNESFSQYMQPSHSFNTSPQPPLQAQPSIPQPSLPPPGPEPTAIGGSNLDNILAAKTAKARLPPPPRAAQQQQPPQSPHPPTAAHIPPPQQIPSPTAASIPPPATTPRAPYTPPTEYQDYPQPPRAAIPPPQQPPSTPVAAVAAPPTPRPVNPAAAAFSAAGGLPQLNKPTPQADSAPAPPRNALLAGIQGGMKLKSAAEAAPAQQQAPAPTKPNLFADIKARPMLRKASVLPSAAPIQQQPAAAAGGLSAVMDILARRGAIADTDSESDDGSDWD